MPSPIVATWTPYGAYWPILTLIYFPLATCVKVSHLAPHFSHIRLATGEPDNSMDGLLSQILGKTYQLSSSCPHSTFLLHFFFENMLSLTRWHSIPNNLSNHSTDQITWEGYSNNNLVFLFEKTQSWDNSCFTSTSKKFSMTTIYLWIYLAVILSHFGVFNTPLKRYLFYDTVYKFCIWMWL